MTAADRATAALWGMVQRQAAILSFLDAFRLLAVVFFLITPFSLAMRRPRSGAGPTGVGGGQRRSAGAVQGGR